MKEMTNGLTLPKNFDETKVTETKRNRLFSRALFKESFESSKRGLFIVSAGNSIIIMIIILILSTLHVNATSSALKDLFSNADMETTIKESAISLYSGFSNLDNAYHSYYDGSNALETTLKKAIDEVEDTTLTSSISTVQTLYDLTYRFSFGTEIEKTYKAKNVAMVTVRNNIDSDDSMNEEEKEFAINVISNYFDIYAEDKSQSVENILLVAIPNTLVSMIDDEYQLSKDNLNALSSYIYNAFNEVYEEDKNSDNVSIEYTFKLLPLLADSNSEALINQITNSLMEAYLLDSEAYINDENIKKTIIINKAASYIVDVVSETAFYKYLPNFIVDYQTSVLGYPITYVWTGEYDENGNEYYDEKEIYYYRPELFIKVQGDMGTVSTILEKKHKEILTGECYSEEEIEQAKLDSLSDIETFKEKLDSFALTISDTPKEDEEISDFASNIVIEEIQNEVINRFNEKNNTNITDISQITAENYSMSGETIMNVARGYVASGIACYKALYKEYLESGLSQSDALEAASINGSKGVIDQLPGKVGENLSEMGDMNIYGIVVGYIAFGLAVLLIPMVYTILSAKSLVSEKVETGSLSFTLSTPTTRRSFIFTEAVFLIFEEIFMAVTILITSILSFLIGILMGSEDLLISLPIHDILLYVLGNFAVTLAISGICFLSSCIFNKTNKAIGIGGGINIAFFIFSILGLFGTNAIPGTVRISLMGIFNYETIFTLFDPLAVMDNNLGVFFFKLMFLFIITIITYYVGSKIFEKKDLPL